MLVAAPTRVRVLDRIAAGAPDERALDHGQQRDASDVDGYGISPREIENDIRDEFGDVVRAVWPTEVFLLDDALEREDVTVERIANFLGGYTLGDNNEGVGEILTDTGRFGSGDRLFDLAIPAAMLPELHCGEANRP